MNKVKHLYVSWIFEWFTFITLLIAISSKYWYDEAFSYLLAHLPMANLIAATAHDVHPPLHYVLIWLIAQTNLLHGELSTRLLSIVFAIGALYVFWLITGELKLPEPVKILSMLLMVLSAPQLYYAQEGRMYSLLELLVLIQFWSVLTRRWWVLGIATTLSLYTHNYAVFYSCMVGLSAFWIELTKTARHVDINPTIYDPDEIEKLPKIQTNYKGLIPSLIIPFVLYIPWVFYGVIPQMEFARSGAHWIPKLTPGIAIYDLFSSLAGTWFNFETVLVLFICVMAGLILTVIFAIRSKQFILIGMALGVWILASLASVTVAPVMLVRALVPSSPFLFILIAMALYQADKRGRLLGAALLVPVVSICLFGLLHSAFTGGIHGDNFVEVPQLNPVEMVVHLEDSTLVTFLAYAQPGQDERLLDAGCPEQLGALGAGARQAMDIKTIKLADLPARYYLAMSVGALSTQCHVDRYKSLKIGDVVLIEKSYWGGMVGLFEHLDPKVARR